MQRTGEKDRFQMGMGRNKDRWNFRSRDQRGISADAGMEHMCNDMDRMYKSAMVENCYRMIDSCHIKVAAIFADLWIGKLDVL